MRLDCFCVFLFPSNFNENFKRNLTWSDQNNFPAKVIDFVKSADYDKTTQFLEAEMTVDKYFIKYAILYLVEKVDKISFVMHFIRQAIT